MQKKIKLLVSPKSLDEAKVVIESGVDYVDCKNPKEGSLGANFPWIIRGMKKLIPNESPQLLSAAIGDFPHLPGSAALAALGAAYSGADIIKVGLMGPKNVEEGVDLMSKVVKSVKRFKSGVKVVVAGYADHSRMNSSPDFLEIPVIANESGADIAMLDTYIKDDKNIFSFLDVTNLLEFKSLSRDLNLEVALAGRLNFQHIERIKKISPDLIGVRSIV
ncbi:MAG: hypothetical protein GF353_26705, partial [Candidatus Lokiarchaeota archaeon]|nr:hypothetical protein [Candidatus Lokiarchaeota archaeon]